MMMRYLIAIVLATGTLPGLAAGQETDTSASIFTVGAIRVIHQKRTVSQSISAQLFLLGGARQIDARTAGIEPLVLNAAALGSAKYPGPASQSAMAALGGSTSIDVNDDWTVYGLHASRPDFEAAWAVFADRIMHPTLSDDAIDKASRGMLANILVSNANPDYVLNQIARPIGFAGHPYANDPNGTDRSLRIMRPSVVRTYHASQFVGSWMLLVVVGNVSRAEVEKLVSASLGTLPAGAYTWTSPPAVPLRKSTMTIIPREMATDYIIGIFPGPVENSRDFGAFKLGTGLLGAYLSYEVREKEQLSYAAGAPLYENMAAAGALYASTPRPERVMELMVKQIEDAGSNELPFQLIPLFSAQFEIEGLMARETNAGQAIALAKAFLIYGDLNATDASFRAIRSVSAGNLRSVVARYVPFIHWVFLGDTSRFRRYMR